MLSVLIQLLSCAVVQDSTRLTEDQMRFILMVKGDWEIKQAFAGTELLKEKMTTKVRFTKNGMILIADRDPQKKLLWRYTKIDTTQDRIDMRIEMKGKIHTYSLRKNEETIWLATRVNGNAEPPDEVKPRKGQLCLVLQRVSKHEIER